MAERTGAERFFVFTDDPAWVRAEVRLPGTTVLVSGSEGGSAVDDFRLMSRAAHVVMANSTFSWWAAWLAERPGSCIVAPAAAPSKVNPRGVDELPRLQALVSPMRYAAGG
ncbi:MAG: alpha-1,2-fucosyltransferase [Planctomycetia bacterium]